MPAPEFFANILQTSGISAAICCFFAWWMLSVQNKAAEQCDEREARMGARIEKLEDENKETLRGLVESTVKALTLSTEVSGRTVASLNRLDGHIQQREPK